MTAVETLEGRIDDLEQARERQAELPRGCVVVVDIAREINELRLLLAEIEQAAEDEAKVMASYNDLVKAIHMLHDQAHGGPFRLCRQDPCRDLDFKTDEAADLTRGPAPASLPLTGEDH